MYALDAHQTQTPNRTRTDALPLNPLGLIAGNGRFPFLLADEARRRGRPVVAAAIPAVAAAIFDLVGAWQHEA